MTKKPANYTAVDNAASHGLPVKMKINKKENLKVVQVWMDKELVEGLREAQIDITLLLKRTLADAYLKVYPNAQ